MAAVVTGKPHIRARVRMDAADPVILDIPPIGGTSPIMPAPHQGASTSRRLSHWRPTVSGPNAVVSASQPELIRRSRDLRRNNPHGKRALDLLTAHIVGMGIKPRPQCSNQKIREQLTELFNQWSCEADADGLLDFYGMQALAVSEMAEAGEIFARLRTRRLSDGLTVPFQVQLIPAEQVPLEWINQTGTTPAYQGIERDQIGRRIAYWMYPMNPNDYWLQGFTNGPVENVPGRVDAADVVHMYNPTRIGQMRGLPWLLAAITTLHQVNQYMDAELLRKQMVAAIVGFVKKATNDDVTPEQLRATFGQINTVLGQDEIPDVLQEPGSMQYLRPGEDVTFNNPADVGATFPAFVAANYRAVAAAIGLLYEELTGDWGGANDRTFRAQFNGFKRSCRQWQYNLVCAQFNKPIWDRFIDTAIASGALKVPKSVQENDIRSVAWNPDRWEYIQPVQDIDATGLEIGLGLISRSAAVAERGDDAEVIDQQIADDHKREADLGLAFGSGLAKATTNPNLSQVAEQGAATPTSQGAGAQGAGGPAQQ
jgi:lambda family phage portal protein